MARALLRVPGVICYFNPNGEVLYDRAGFDEVWDGYIQQDTLPLPLWMNVRFFSPNVDCGLMDTVGNKQLDIRDVEALFPQAKYDPSDIDRYLRNVTRDLPITQSSGTSSE